MRRGGSVSGAVSLVMIFCVLCLAVFTVLTLACAQRERSLAELTEQRAEEYYAADYEAVRLTAALRRGERPGEPVRYEERPEGTLAEFSLPAGGEQELSVRLLLTGEDCQILQWQTRYAGEWESEDSLSIWEGF